MVRRVTLYRVYRPDTLKAERLNVQRKRVRALNRFYSQFRGLSMCGVCVTELTPVKCNRYDADNGR